MQPYGLKICDESKGFGMGWPSGPAATFQRGRPSDSFWIPQIKQQLYNEKNKDQNHSKSSETHRDRYMFLQYLMHMITYVPIIQYTYCIYSHVCTLL